MDGVLFSVGLLIPSPSMPEAERAKAAQVGRDDSARRLGAAMKGRIFLSERQEAPLFMQPGQKHTFHFVGNFTFREVDNRAD